jgi:acyl carrier protein
MALPSWASAGLPLRPELDKRRAEPLFRRNGVAGDAPLGQMGIPMDRDEVDSRIRSLIEPFNTNAVAIGEGTTFAGDLEFDSLKVMDFVAAIEDEFDIIITMNQQAEIENYGQLVDAVQELTGE